MSDDQASLEPLERGGHGGHLSLVRLPAHWYIACRSHELGNKPIRRTILGTPLVLFRDRARGLGAPEGLGALLDRCAHRNAPLSEGRVVESGHLQCRYHGWQFDTAGVCRLVPCLVAPGEAPGRRVESYAARDQDGFVWVFAQPDVAPPVGVDPFSLAAKPGYTTVVREVEVEATLHATAENILDVPHTAYLHRGLFRGDQASAKLSVEVRRWSDRVEAEYMGEPRPPGLAAKLLSPSGGVVEHWDRFILPSICQVEYRLGAENHILITTVLTPVSDFVTRMYAVVSFRVRLPGWLLKAFLTPLAMRIFKQDAEILKLQSENIRRFGGERFMSTEVDELGREIWPLLGQAERGIVEGKADEAPAVRRLELMV